MDYIVKPEIHHPWRRRLGKECYILKRRVEDLFSRTRWSEPGVLPIDSLYPIKTHSSLMLRSLQGVDFYLQENKRTNLRLAIAHLDNMIIQPGETFSVWRNVGRPTTFKGYLEGMNLCQGKSSKA